MFSRVQASVAIEALIIALLFAAVIPLALATGGAASGQGGVPAIVATPLAQQQALAQGVKARQAVADCPENQGLRKMLPMLGRFHAVSPDGECLRHEYRGAQVPATP